MDTAERITRGFGRAYDGERRALLPAGSVLRLIEHEDGQDDEDVALVTSGWRPFPQRQAGQVEGGLRIDVVETSLVTLDPGPPPVLGVLTAELLERAGRLTYTPDGTVFVVTNFDKPSDAPRQWVLWARELVVGAVTE